MINCRLMWFLERNRLICDFQMGCRKFRSTVDQLVSLENAIQCSFEARKHLVAIFFDLEKAYDMTWRYGVLKVLHEWGLKGNLPKFIHSFLEHRQFKVRIGNTLSDVHNLENGIPQGSTLSVTLFAIAVNDIISSIDPSVGRSLYVDDLAIYFSNKNLKVVQETLQIAINDITEKAKMRGFRFSVAKTHGVHFCRRRIPHNDPQLFINNTPLIFHPQVKFLGLIFDKKLTWRPHIEDLAVRCKKALNLVRCMASIKWGADREILLKLYKTLVMSKMDYGCIVYSGARKSQLKVLETIHNTGLRLITGAFRTSPVISLCCESGIPPLHYRRERLILNYGIKIWAQPTHPNYPILFNNEQNEIFESRPTITRPMGVRLQEFLNKVNEVLPPVYPLTYCEIPPWKLKIPRIHLEGTVYKKGEVNNISFLISFYSIIDSYPSSVIIYTDGSKTGHGTASAFTCMGKSYSWTLHPMASIYTAELYAIWQALRFIDFSPEHIFLICSDSLSALVSISNSNCFDPLVQNILALSHYICNTGKQLSFIWTPGHIGITGNELADTAARSAADNGHSENIPIRLEDIKAYFKDRVDHTWQDEWNIPASHLHIYCKE